MSAGRVAEVIAKFTSRIKPKSGFSPLVHLFFTALVPALIYVFVQWNLVGVAFAIILLSKWRMFSVQPRHWWSNIRANAVDLIVGVSAVVFMTQTASSGLRLLWAVAYGVWLIVMKPRSSILAVSLQAIIGQAVALIALFLAWGDQPLGLLVVSAGAICYLSARHFFISFEEPYAPLYGHSWGYFGAALAWVLGHWLLFYGVLAQPALLLSVLGFGLGALYYLEQTDRLSVVLRRQFIFIMIAIVIVVLAFSDWGDKAV